MLVDKKQGACFLSKFSVPWLMTRRDSRQLRRPTADCKIQAVNHFVSESSLGEARLFLLVSRQKGERSFRERTRESFQRGSFEGGIYSQRET